MPAKIEIQLTSDLKIDNKSTFIPERVEVQGQSYRFDIDDSSRYLRGNIITGNIW